MFGEWDMRRTNTKYKGGIDLKVSMIRGNILRIHCDKKILLLFCVNKLNKSTLDKRIDVYFLFCQFCKILMSNKGITIFQYDQRSSCPATIGENHDISVVFLM